MKKVRLIFADGRVFEGRVFTTSSKDCFGEVVFNTGMSGYQEIFTDPSYSGQLVLMTYPLIGNYGINTQDNESSKIHLNGLIVREYCDFPSNWRSEKSLKTFLDEHNIFGADDFDTRAITKHVRKTGSQKAILTTSQDPLNLILSKIDASPDMIGQNLAKTVTTSKAYIWSTNDQSPNSVYLDEHDEKMDTCSEIKSRYSIAVIDCGIKWNILRQLERLGCKCTVFPLSVSSKELLSGKFDGVFISNGPGDPEPLHDLIQVLRDIIGKRPIFGICLGHQLLCLALGGKSYKLDFGHHGINQPVKDMKTGKVEITSQNHGFCIDKNSLDPREVELSHINLNDGSLEGIRHKVHPLLGIQYHPESAPGPHDSHYLFSEFINMMKAEITQVQQTVHKVE